MPLYTTVSEGKQFAHLYNQPPYLLVDVGRGLKHIVQSVSTVVNILGVGVGNGLGLGTLRGDVPNKDGVSFNIFKG